jgi:hypothetical protein
MMRAVDQADSAQYSREDILEPQGWTLLNYLMDARTGLGRFRNFRISNYTLMMQLIDYCRTHGIHDILGLPDVKERVEIYLEHADKAREQIQRCTRSTATWWCWTCVAKRPIWATNRFMIYALPAGCNISIHVMWGLKQQNTVLATGKSILDRSQPHPCRRADAGAWRRWPRSRRHLPGGQRPGRCGAAHADPAHQRRRLSPPERCIPPADRGGRR